MNSGSDETRGLDQTELKQVLQSALDMENELLRTYVITAERIHGNDELKERLQNFSEGNAKRTRQLIDEISMLEGSE